MTIRFSLLRLSLQHRLSAQDRARLFQLGGTHAEPPGVDLLLARGIGMLAAALAALSLVFWIAANWAALGRLGSFALLQTVFVLATAAAFAWPRARTAFALVALGAAGGLLAYFGQTYQTGADPWQLFAWWSLLTLPLCLAVRRDALWAPWAIVTACAIALWVRAHTGGWWNVHADERFAYLAGWTMSAALVLLLSHLARRWTGAGDWALRLAAMTSVALIAPQGGAAMFGPVELGCLALVLLAVLAWLFSTGPRFDLFILSTAGLGINVVLIIALLRIFVWGSRAETGAFLIVGLCAALLLATTVKAISALSTLHDKKGRP